MPKKLNNKRSILLATAAVLLIAGGAYALYSRSSAPKKTTTTSKTEPTQTQKDEANNLDKPNEDATPSKATTTETKGSVATTPSFSLIMTQPAGSDEVVAKDGTLRVRTAISGASSGSCSLVLTGPGGQKITKSANFAPQTSYSSCSFDVAGNQLAVGAWKLSLQATSGGATSNAINQGFTVQ